MNKTRHEHLIRPSISKAVVCEGSGSGPSPQAVAQLLCHARPRQHHDRSNARISNRNGRGHVGSAQELTSLWVFVSSLAKTVSMVWGIWAYRLQRASFLLPSLYNFYKTRFKWMNEWQNIPFKENHCCLSNTGQVTTVHFRKKRAESDKKADYLK